MTFDELIGFPIDKFLSLDATIAYWSTAASLIDDIEILAQWGFISLRPRGTDGKLLQDREARMLHDPAPVGTAITQIWRKG